MTDILCGWLNTEIQLDVIVTRENFGDVFWNGFRIGMIMDRNLLQPNFQYFSPKKVNLMLQVSEESRSS